MEELITYELTEKVEILTTGGLGIWDKGEQFILIDAEKKRHGEGRYPKRLISLSDGSMIAFSVIQKIEKNLGRWVKTYKTWEISK